MDRASYIAASGGLRQLRRLDVVTNNIANVNTVGFKRQMIVSTEQMFEDTLAAELGDSSPYSESDHERVPGTTDIETVTDFSLGSFTTSGRSLDAALPNPSDFFVVNTPNGQEYTRAGNFSLGPQGILVSAEGFTIQGDGGEITIEGGTPAITPSGAITVNGDVIGRLQVVRVGQTQFLERVSAARFKATSPQAQAVPQDNPEVMPQTIETSNVSAVQGMVDMVVANRAFEAYTKAAKTIDEMNQVAITQVGRRR